MMQRSAHKRKAVWTAEQVKAMLGWINSDEHHLPYYGTYVDGPWRRWRCREGCARADDDRDVVGEQVPSGTCGKKRGGIGE